MRVDVNGVGIEYEVTGDGPPVVLLHGFPDSGRLWRHQVPALAEAGSKVIVPDMRGYGRSDKPTEVEAYTMDLPPERFRQSDPGTATSQGADDGRVELRGPRADRGPDDQIGQPGSRSVALRAPRRPRALAAARGAE